ncbi:MAG: galactokinase [Cellulosilyticum sp.]|nr:galactokinase [Cellulosilyticum sp.]
MNVADIQSKFSEVFGKTGEGIYFAPGRINLIGEHIDYNGGMVFPAAITLGTYAVVAPRKDKVIHAYSINASNLGVIGFNLSDTVYNEAHQWVNYIKGVAKYLQEEKGEFPHGLDILVYGNIPNAAGLSSSASLEMLMAHIFRCTYDLDLSPVDAALLGKRVENEYIGVNSGIMDQFSISLGKKEKAILLNCNTLDYTYYPIELKGNKIIIMYTNKRRALADSKYNERRSECDAAISKLKQFYEFDVLCDLTLEQLEAHKEALTEVEYKRTYHSISENTRVKEAAKALQQGKLQRFGELLKASHISLRDDYEVSGIELDTLVETAWKEPDVVGARMTGAGFGGSAFAIVKEESVASFIQAVGKVYKDKIGYEADFYIAEIGEGPVKLESIN